MRPTLLVAVTSEWPVLFQRNVVPVCLHSAFIWWLRLVFAGDETTR